MFLQNCSIRATHGQTRPLMTSTLPNSLSVSVRTSKSLTPRPRSGTPVPERIEHRDVATKSLVNMFARKIKVQYTTSTGPQLCPIKWLDNFSMRNFTNDRIFDDTLPVADGELEI